ncbi:MAG: sulfite exporter TauE/SafE family protein [Proteobacteria bacterium]|nr:sulfite exporter TauE/SafE family protein [Pseudomonadota bacterium]
MSSIEALYLTFLATGFVVGFGHCIGMCGPIVVSFSLNLKTKGVMAPNLLYHAGRIFTYAVLGGVMGATGAFTRITTGIGSLQKGAMIFAGLIIIVMGLGMSGWIPLGQIFGNYCRPEGIISRSFRKLSGIQSTAAFLPLGLVLGLLPCGPVYTALIAAAGLGMETQNTFKAVLSGMGLMTLFGIGTIPSLLMVARLSGMGWLKSRDIIYKIGSMLMIGVGIYFLIKGLRF